MIAEFGAYRRLATELAPRIHDFHVRALDAAPEKAEFANHVQNAASWYAYVFYFSLIQKFLPDRDAILLDWGGQFGHVSALLQTYYANTICYVADQCDLLEYWQDKFETHNIALKADSDPFDVISLPSDHVDAAISSGVLEHTQEFGVKESEALQELHRVLKSGGLLFIYHLPTRYGFPEIMNKLIGRWYHPIRYSRREIVDLVEGAGFEIVCMDKHEFLYPKLREILGRFIGHANAFRLDYAFSKLPLISIMAQHFTIVARKRA